MTEKPKLSIEDKIALHNAQQAEAERIEREEARIQSAKEEDAFNRRLEKARRIVEQWDSLGVPEMLRDINTSIWKGYGEYSGNEKQRFGRDNTDRWHKLTAALIEHYSEKTEPVTETRFGRYYKEEYSSGVEMGPHVKTTSHFGFHEVHVGNRVLGFEQPYSQDASLTVELNTGGGKSDYGSVQITDYLYDFKIPDFDFEVGHYWVKRYTGNLVKMPFSQDEFSLSNTSALLDSVLVASSIARSDFVDRIKEGQASKRRIESRIGRIISK